MIMYTRLDLLISVQKEKKDKEALLDLNKLLTVNEMPFWIFRTV